MQQMERAWEALQPVEPEAGISPYTIRVALAGVSGVLFLLLGISMIIYEAIALGVIPMTGHYAVNDGFSRAFSSFWLSSVFPAIPGILAAYHYVRIKRCFEAGENLEARRASNYASTWAQIALWTWIGLGVSWLLFTAILAAALVFILLIIVAVLIVLAFVVFSSLSSGSGSRRDNRGSDDSGDGSAKDGRDRGWFDNKDPDDVRQPGERFSRNAARRRIQIGLINKQERERQARKWRW